MFRDDYDEIYRIDADDDWKNSGYDENGDEACCVCGESIRWSPIDRLWFCPKCGLQYDRADYFECIDANPPGVKCLTQCQENYPFCKKYCPWYKIPKDDPMID